MARSIGETTYIHDRLVEREIQEDLVDRINGFCQTMLGDRARAAINKHGVIEVRVLRADALDTAVVYVHVRQGIGAGEHSVWMHPATAGSGSVNGWAPAKMDDLLKNVMEKVLPSVDDT